ncbi:MAG: hypothetical protein COB78_12050 [Hyphomicrobiales bacterium]|nr:MAG: hypothetical protein COB78_12050 [Hyphomicrobiales bacterium]
MALVITLSAASSNLVTYLQDYEAEFTPYNGNGWFSSSYLGQDQWTAGTDTEGVDNGQSSVIMDIEDYDYSPGMFSGDVNSLTLGHNLEYDPGSDVWVQDNELTIVNDSGYMPITSTFSEAIYTLSHGGLLDGGNFFGMQFAGLTDYFGEQGTVQIGNVGLNDTLLGFDGQDTFVFQDGSLFDTVDNYDITEDILDVSAWGATGLGDLVIGEFGGTTTIFSSDFSDSIEVLGVVGLTAANFEFA